MTRKGAVMRYSRQLFNTSSRCSQKFEDRLSKWPNTRRIRHSILLESNKILLESNRILLESSKIKLPKKSNGPLDQEARWVKSILKNAQTVAQVKKAAIAGRCRGGHLETRVLKLIKNRTLWLGPRHLCFSHQAHATIKWHESSKTIREHLQTALSRLIEQAKENFWWLSLINKVSRP